MRRFYKRNADNGDCKTKLFCQFRRKALKKEFCLAKTTLCTIKFQTLAVQYLFFRFIICIAGTEAPYLSKLHLIIYAMLSIGYFYRNRILNSRFNVSLGTRILWYNLHFLHHDWIKSAGNIRNVSLFNDITTIFYCLLIEAVSSNAFTVFIIFF